LIAIDHTGLIISTFGFLSNATVIETFIINNIIQLSDRIVFNGTFNLTALISSTLSIITASSITVDLNGSIISFNSSPLFVNRSNYYYQIIPVNLYCYALDLIPDNLNKSVIRFTLDGIQDLSFTINVNYQPRFIRITDSGLIYTISNVTSGLNPYTNLVTNLVRIDRFLSTGLVDNSFTTVYISPLTVIDISPLDNNGLYIFVQPLDGLGPNTTIPLVNGISNIPHNPQFKSLGTWEPIIHILEDGTYDSNYIQSIEPVLYTSIYDYTANQINIGDKVLFSDNEGVTLFTYKQNEITRLEFIQPIRFDSYGNSAPNIKGVQIPSQIQTFMRWIKTQDPSMNLQYNGNRWQYQNSECGMFCLYFIIRMIMGDDFKAFVKYKPPDSFMLNLRSWLFST